MVRGATRRPLIALALVATTCVALVAQPVQADFATGCSAPTQTYGAGTMPSSLNISAGDVVLFTSGTFTGTMNDNGGRVCVAAGAVYSPSNLNVNGPGELFVDAGATAVLPTIAAGAGAILDNAGDVTFNVAPNTNGYATVINRAGATLTVVGSQLTLANGVVVTNDGIIDVQGAINLNGASTVITNNGIFTAGGSVTSAGEIVNTNQFDIVGQLTLNSGAGLNNQCALSATAFSSASPGTNSGLIDLGSGAFVNQGSALFTQAATGYVLGGDFTNNAAVTGFGSYRFTGTTTTQGTFIGDSAADPIVFEDTTVATGIFDLATGPVSNVVAGTVTPPSQPLPCEVTPTPDPDPYHILVNPTTATNRLGEMHSFFVELRTDADGDGAVDDPLVGAEVDLQWSGAAGSGMVTVNGAEVPGAPSSTASCTTLTPVFPYVGGLCRVDVSSPDDVGSGELVASFDLPNPIDGAPDLPTPNSNDNCTAPTVVGDVITVCNDTQSVVRVEDAANKTWVGFDVTVEADAANPVDVDHTFTIDVVNTDGTTQTAVEGATVDFTWAAAGTITSVNGVPGAATSCVTSSAGQCTVVVNSSDAGTGTLAVTSVAGDLGLGDGVQLVTPTPSSDLVASKTWVDWRVVLSPLVATNAVGESHTFLASLQRDDGSGWVADPLGSEVFFSWSGVAGSEITAVSAGAVTGPTSAFCQPDASGECTVTVDSIAGGAGSLVAFEVVTGLVGYTPPGGGTTFSFDVVDVSADKTWVAVRGSVSPGSAVNVVGDDHELAVLIETSDGGGWVGAPAGSTVGFVWSGVGSVSGVVDPGPVAGSCTLVAGGTCVVTVGSGVPGVGVLTVGEVTSLVIDGTELVPSGGGLAVSDADPSPGVDSRVGSKTWVEFSGDVAPTATNLTGDDHTFTAELFSDLGGGPVPVPDGSIVEFGWTGPGSPFRVCLTVGGGCDIVVSSPSPASGTLSITSIAATISGTALVGDPTTSPPSLVATAGGSLSADKTWIDVQAAVTPSATNLVGDDHVFTLTAAYDDGSGPAAVPDGSTITYTWTGATAASPASSCVTTGGNGTCDVTVASAVPGSGTLTIDSVTTTINGTTFTDVTALDPIGTGSLSSTKTWIDITVGVVDSGVNPVGDDHVFTLTAVYDDGGGSQPADGVSVAFDWSGAGTASPSPCVAAPTANTCQVTVSSSLPGSGTITIESVTATVNGATFTDVPAVATAGASLTADKTWVEFSGDVAPTATNLTGDDHTFTIDVGVDDGTGVAAVPDGSTVGFVWTGGGAVTEVNGAPDVGAVECVTSGGSCTVTVDSAVPGAGTIEVVSVDATISGVALTGLATTTPPSLVATAGGALTADKTWIELTVGVADSGTNLTGDDHLFVLTAVYDDGSGPQPADGASFAYTWTGSGTAAPPAPCVAAAAENTCEVTVSSTDPGVGTITIDSVTATIGATTFSDVVAAATPGESLTADKSWLEFDVDITPLEAVNEVGEEHTFTISVRVDDGSGLVPLAVPASAGSVEWTFDAPDGSTTAGTCVLTTGGVCEVVQNSDVGGIGTLTATALDVVYDGVVLPTVDLTATASGQSPDLSIPVGAVKAWVGYSLVLDPVDAVNLWPADPDHVVTVSLDVHPADTGAPISGQAIDLTLVSTVATITGVSDGTFGATTATCVTDAVGDCRVTITSTGPGSATLTADYAGVFSASPVRVQPVEDAHKTWQGFRVRVTPPDATNLLGNPHTFEVVVETTTDGTTWLPVAGAAPTLDLAAPATISAQTCSAGTDSSGRCTVTVGSPTTTRTTLEATYRASLGGNSSDFVDSAQKTWIDYRITVDPSSAENLVDTDHSVTVTVEIDRGDGSGFVPLRGARPTLSTGGVGGIESQTCTSGTGPNGTCTATIRSTEPGVTTVTARYTGAAGGETATYSASATKEWVDYRLTVTPARATNEVGETNTFDVLLEVDRGAGPASPQSNSETSSAFELVGRESGFVQAVGGPTFAPAPGQIVRLSSTGVGRISGITPSSGGSSCRTDPAGRCRFTVTSAVAGTQNLTASFGAAVGGTTRAYSDASVQTWTATPDSGGSGGALPPTGSDARGFAAIGAVFAAVGGVLVVGSRRRRLRRVG